MSTTDLPEMGILWKGVPEGHFTVANRQPSVIVVHCTDNSASANQEWRYAASPFGDGHPKVSWHFCVDDEVIIQSVLCKDEAWCAGHTANRLGIHIELCGWEKWTREEWLTHQLRIQHAGSLINALCAKYGIPKTRLTVNDLQTGHRGICGHSTVSAAWNETTHTDPGPGFPWDILMGNEGHDIRDTFNIGGIMTSFPYVRYGDTGRKVKIVQGLLNAWGISTTVDGIWGPQTDSSVRRFQRDHSLSADGIVGPLTMGALLNVG